MKYILAIDQGTTGSRAVAYNRRGEIAASAHEEFRQYFPKPGWVEHDPDEIWQSVKNTARKVLKKIGAAEVAAIGITNQRETTVVWDRDTGRPVHRAIVWQCRRTADRCEGLRRIRGNVRAFREKTGLPIDAYFSATKIEWILKNVPGAAVKARWGRLCFGTTDSWVLWKLTGGLSHATDYTNASRTMLFNINSMKWDDELLRIFGVPRSILPEVKRSSGLFGTTNMASGLDAGIPVYGIAGDQQAALFGQACFEPGSIKNTYGTGAFMLMNAGRKKPVTKHGLIVTVACGRRGEPVYALEGAIFSAGSAIQWLRDGLGIIKKASQSAKMAASIDDNGGVYLVPAFVGMGAPYWDQHARGAVFGLTRGTRREHLVRAAVEAMCYQTKDVMTAMQKDTGLKIKALKVDGGASANDLLCSFQAGLLGMDVVRPRVIEITSLGAAYLAGLASGYWKNAAEIAKCWRVDKVFRPRMARDEAARLYEGWQNAVRRTLSAY